MIRHLNPRPGVRFSGPGPRSVEPDVYFIRDGEEFLIQMNEEELPQLRLNAQYRKMLERDQGATKEVRDYVRERYSSAIQLMKNIRTAGSYTDSAGVRSHPPSAIPEFLIARPRRAASR